MLVRTTRSQIAFQLRQKEALFTFLALLLMVMVTWMENGQMFLGMDVTNLPHTTKMSMLSYNRLLYDAKMGTLFQQVYPLLVVCPAGFILAKERGSGEHILMITRMGSRNYYCSKFIAAFVVTAVVFTLPFLLEVLFHILAFSTKPDRDYTRWSEYSEEYVSMVRNFMFYKVFAQAPYVYAVMKILLFGLFSGLMGAFSVAVSALYRVKLRITVMLPVFLLLNLTVYVSSLWKELGQSVAWYDFVMLHDDMTRNDSVFVLGLIAVMLISVGSIWRVSRRDQL